ncbi:MAG: hypothetical protein ACJ74Y_04615, partial [Bryobacteraceae bacterium]
MVHFRGRLEGSDAADHIERGGARHALLRRGIAATKPRSRLADLEIDIPERSVKRSGSAIEL